MKRGVNMCEQFRIALFFYLFFCVSAFLYFGIETLVQRKMAQKRYIKNLETENQKLKRTVNFLSFELETKEL